MIQKFIGVFLLLVGGLWLPEASAQEVPLHVDNDAVYDFVDELANKGIVTVNSVAKPYTRNQIAQWLLEAEGNPALTPRQQKTVQFYLRDFSKSVTVGKFPKKRFDLFYYSDSLFQVTANIVGGIRAGAGESELVHRYNGAEVYGRIGKMVSFYGSLRDNFENEQFTGRQKLVTQRGAVYKGYYRKSDYSEARGGVVLNWKWGSAGLHKDHVEWGNHYGGANILSGHQPSVAYVTWKAHPVRWFEYQYLHAWLVSEVVDSARTYGSGYEGEREMFVNKYLAASLLTLKPWPKLHVSLGNSMVYADGGVNPVYFIPFLFFKSADHTYNGSRNNVGHNSQMFLDISSRQLNRLHVYGSLMIDEIYLGQMFNKAKQSNFLSFKLGARATDWLPNTSFTLEYTRNNPLVYTHIYPSTSFESNGYVLGHYLRDNADEWFGQVRVKPLRGLDLMLTVRLARKGKAYQEIIDRKEFDAHPEIQTEEPRWGLPFLNQTLWKKQNVTLKARYEVVHDLFVFAEYAYHQIKGAKAEVYSMPWELEGNNRLWFGIHFGY